jgi:hypothetical protein
VAVGGGTTVGALLRFLEPHVSDCIGAGPAAAIRLRADRLPLAGFRLIGLELPLGASERPADLLLALAPRAALRALTDPLGDGPALARLLTALTDAGHELFGRIGDAWLEYDVGSGDGRRPSLFAAPAEPSVAPRLGRLLGASSAAASGLERLVGALGAEDWVQQVGVMLGRAEPELRCVLRSDTGSVAPGRAALNRCSWPGDGAELDRVLADYGSLARLQSVAVGFEPDGGLSAAGAAELHFPFREGAERVLQRLEADGLAAPGTSSRLLAWDGHAVQRSGESFPERFQAITALTGGRARSAIVRRIHHVKLTVVPNRPLTAKAYLGAQLMLTL